ncbi:MAG: protein kinase [Polyangiaceae bacterium]
MGTRERTHPTPHPGSRIRSSEPGAPVQIGRYRIEERLGAGGMGVVYVATNTDRGERVALKTLQHVSADGLLRLKNEFRSVADVLHPNLVVLHELVGEDDEWFFTMELVAGDTFLASLRGEPAPAPPRTVLRGDRGEPEGDASGSRTRALPSIRADDQSEGATLVAPSADGGRSFAPRSASRDEVTALSDSPTATAAETRTSVAASLDRIGRREKPTALSPEGVTRLRDSLRQLAEGVQALHDARKLHRDLKPTNVMVDPTGRVVILDFGLVSDAGPNSARGARALEGTPAYMAPELVCFGASSPASDWYAVGVMLYQALTGVLPHDGETANEILSAKVAVQPLRPSELVEAPPDLDELCVSLLARQPTARPSGEEILSRLGARGAARRGPEGARGAQPPFRLLGREREFARLVDAAYELSAGKPVIAYVEGASGMGKSALSESFLADRAASGALVLRGRCFERETLPFKLFDGVVDELARALDQLPRDLLIELLPPHLHDLARVFPVLLESNALGVAPQPMDEARDPKELRQRAFLALKQLLHGLAAIRPLVIHVDDIQWGDLDSVRLFEELVAPPAAPAALFLCSFRSEEREKSPCLARLLDPQSPAARSGAVRRIEVQPLAPEDAFALALSLMIDKGEAAETRATAIARESLGSPLFVEQLVRYAETRAIESKLQGAPAEASTSTERRAEVSLEDLVAARLAPLPVEARRLLEIVATAGGPIQIGVALAAADVGARAHLALGTLRGSRLVRALGVHDGDTVESYHDRIRESGIARAYRRTSRSRITARSLERSRRTPIRIRGASRSTCIRRGSTRARPTTPSGRGSARSRPSRSSARRSSSGSRSTARPRASARRSSASASARPSRTPVGAPRPRRIS